MGAEIISQQENLKIESEGMEVYATGTVHTFSPDHIKFHIEDLILDFEFRNDEGEMRVDEKVTGDKSAKWVLYNFPTSIRAGSNQPLRIGNLGDRELFFAFTVSALDPEESIKIIHYTFYLGGSVDG